MLQCTGTKPETLRALQLENLRPSSNQEGAGTIPRIPWIRATPSTELALASGPASPSGVDTSHKKTAALKSVDLVHPPGGQTMPWDWLGPRPPTSKLAVASSPASPTSGQTPGIRKPQPHASRHTSPTSRPDPSLGPPGPWCQALAVQ